MCFQLYRKYNKIHHFNIFCFFIYDLLGSVSNSKLVKIIFYKEYCIKYNIKFSYIIKNRQRYEEEWEIPHGARGNMRCFGNLIVIFSYLLCNILYSIMKRFSFIRGCKLKPHSLFVDVSLNLIYSLYACFIFQFLMKHYFCFHLHNMIRKHIINSFGSDQHQQRDEWVYNFSIISLYLHFIFRFRTREKKNH